MKRCVRIKVLGKVQGVFYREYVQDKAQKLQIGGTVQNSSDGSVLIYACGFSEKLDDLIDALYKGSSKSKVEDVIVEPLVPEKDFRGVFRVIGHNRHTV